MGNAVGDHPGYRVGDVGMPIAHANVDRLGLSDRGQQFG